MRDSSLNQETPHRRVILKVLSVFSFVAGILFAAINFQRGMNFLAAMELMTGLLGVYVFISLVRGKCDERLSYVFVVVFCVAVLFAMHDARTQISVFVWIFLVPVLSYITLGQSLGMLCTAVIGAAGSIITYAKLVGLDEAINMVDVMNVLVAWSIVWALCHSHENARAKSQSLLLDLSKHDVLTGLANRRALVESFKQHWTELGKDAPGCLLRCDIDGFEQINYDYGYKAADKALMVVADFLADNAGPNHHLYRIGSDEFCLLLPEASHIRATVTAKLLCQKLADITIELDDEISLHVTMSVGVARRSSETATLDRLMTVAGENLSVARRDGGNRVVGADIELPPTPN